MSETTQPKPESLTQETKITFETACGLQRREDAVLSGTDLRIGFLMKDERGKDLSNDQKKAKAEELANKLNSLEENNKPILGKKITDQEILSLSTKIGELLKSDKFAGIFVNILGEKGQGGEASALAMVAFLDYINSHSQEPHEQLLKGAYEQVSKVLKAAGGGKISFATALVDKKGELTAVNLDGQKILIFAQEQSRMKTITEGKEGDGTPKIQKIQLQNGDKIILCAKDVAVDKIDRTKEVKKIVESLTSAKDAQAVSGGEGKNVSTIVQKNQSDGDQLRQITLMERIIIVDRDEKEGGRKVSAKDYIKTEEYKQRRQIVDRMLKPNGKNYDPEVLRILPRRQNESDKEYEYRLFKQLEEELRNLGESRDLAKDNLYHFFYRPKGVSNQIFNLRQTDLLKIAEATRKVLAYDLNYQKATQERRDLLEAKRQQMRTVERTNEILYKIVNRGTPIYAEGNYREIFERGHRTSEAEADISAFKFILDYLDDQNIKRIIPLLEIEDNSEEAQQYNEILKSLVSKVRSQDGQIKYEDLLKAIREGKNQEKDEKKRFLYRLIDANLRHLFYHSIEQALQYRESYNLESVNPFVRDLIQRLNKISLTKEEISSLGNNYDVLFSAALKGAEYLRRMAKEPVKLPQPEEVDLMMIIDKDEYQGLTLKDIAEPDESESGSATGGTPRREPPNGSGGSPRSPEPPDIPAAPTPEDNRGGNGKGNGEGKNGEPPPASGTRTEPGGPSGPSPTPQPEPQPPPTELNIAFASVDIGAENTADVSRHITSQNEEIFRNKLFRIGKVRLDPIDLVADGLAYLSGKLAYKGQVKRGVGVIPALLVNTPSMVLGAASGLLKGVRHPGHYFWQGMVMKDAFDSQRRQFAADMVGIARRGLVSGDREKPVSTDVIASLPVKISSDLIDLAMRKGSQLRNKNFSTRLKGWGTDLIYNITGLGGGLSSEQKLARQWLEQQIELYKQGKDNDVDPDFKKQWQKLEQSYLEEQEAHGAKFTVEGALEETAGETRFELKSENEPLASAAEKKLKEIIAKYAPQLKTATDERAKRELKKQLALEVNQYLRSDEFYGQLTTQQREAFSAKEIASNVTAIAEQVAQRWDENGYLKPKGKDGKTLWDEIHLNIFLARGAGGGVRGKTEYGGIEGIGQWREKLERRIAERSIGICAPGMSQALARAEFSGSMFAKGVLRFFKEGTLAGLSGFAGYEAAPWVYGGVYYSISLLKSLWNREVINFGRAGGIIAGAAVAASGVGIVPVIGAAAGVGLVAAIKERSRLAQERYQMSREVALGRVSSPFALLRQEMIRALVPPRKADELIADLANHLNKDFGSLRPFEVRQLALALSEVTARLNITNLSQREGALQHLIQYEEGRDMRQNAELTTLLAQGRLKLWEVIKDNEQLKNLVLLGQKADNEGEFLQAFDKVVSLTEAQLRFGSEGKALKRIEDWLKREKTRFGFNTDQEVKTFVQKILSDWNLKVGRELTIDQANRNFGVLRARRMGQVFLTSVMTSGISWGLGELGITRPVSEIRDGIKAELDEYKQEGFNQWFQDWKNVVVNDRFDLEINGAGKLVADLTPFQRGVLQARNFFEPPPFQPIHTQIIDGIKVTLPGFYQWQEVNIGGKNYDGLVDLRTGDVIDMSNYRIDTPEGLQQFEADLKAAGAEIVDIKEINIPGQPKIETKDLLISQGQAQILNPVTGKMMLAPQGANWHSEWRRDGDKYDLVAIDNSTNQPIVDHLGQQKILIDDAQLTKDGQIVGGTYDHNLIRINQGRVETRVGEPQLVFGEKAVEEWKAIIDSAKEKTEIKSNIWWTNMTPGSDRQELRAYDYVVKNVDGSLSLIIDGSRMGETINPLTGQIEKVSDIISDPTRAPYGLQLALFIPGIGKIIIDDISDGEIDQKFNFNPSLETPVYSCGQSLGDGQQTLTMGDLAKQLINQSNIANYYQSKGISLTNQPITLASQLNNVDAYNLGNDGKPGYFVLSFVDANNNLNHLATGMSNSPIAAIEIPSPERIMIPPAIEMINKITDRIEHPADTTVTTITIKGRPLEPPPKVYWPLPYTVRETLEKSHPPSKPQDQPVRPPTTGVPTDTTSPTSQPPTDLSQKPVGIDREALPEDLKPEYDRVITPAIKELIEALKSDDDKKIKEAKRKLIDNLKQLDEKAKGKPGYKKPVDPDRSVEDLEKGILTEIGQEGKQFEGKTERELRLLLDERKRQLEELDRELPQIPGGDPQLEKKKRTLIKEIAEIETRLKKIPPSSSPPASSPGQDQKKDQSDTGQGQLPTKTAEARLNDGGKSKDDKEIAKRIQETEKELTTTLNQFFQKSPVEQIKQFMKTKFDLELEDKDIDEIRKNNTSKQALISKILTTIKERKVNEYLDSKPTESTEAKLAGGEEDEERRRKLQQLETRAHSEVSQIDKEGKRIYDKFWQFYRLVNNGIEEKIQEFRENNNREPSEEEKDRIRKEVRSAVAKKLQLISEPTDEDEKKFNDYLSKVKAKMSEMVLNEPKVKREILSDYEAMIKEIKEKMEKGGGTGSNNGQSSGNTGGNGAHSSNLGNGGNGETDSSQGVGNTGSNEVVTKNQMNSQSAQLTEAQAAITPEQEKQQKLEQYINEGLELIKQAQSFSEDHPKRKEFLLNAIKYFTDKTEAQKIGGERFLQEGRFFAINRPPLTREELEELVHTFARNNWFKGYIELSSIVNRQNPTLDAFSPALLEEMVLCYAEEWIHALQESKGGNLVLEKGKDYEADVAAYLDQKGVKMTDDFLRRYDRAEIIGKVRDIDDSLEKRPTFRRGVFVRYNGQENWQIVGFDPKTGKALIKNTANPNSNPIAIDLKELVFSHNNQEGVYPFQGINQGDWQELEKRINGLKGIFDSRGQYIEAKALIKLINEVRSEQKEIAEIPRSGGLRRVVDSLITAEQGREGKQLGRYWGGLTKFLNRGVQSSEAPASLNLPQETQRYLQDHQQTTGRKLEGKDLEEFLKRYESLGKVAEALLDSEKAKEEFWDVQKCEKRFHEAIALLGRETRFRTPRNDGKLGAVVDYRKDPNIRKIYFVGDLHGNKWYLARLLQNPQIRAELASGEAVLVTAGDGIHGELPLKQHSSSYKVEQLKREDCLLVINNLISRSDRDFINLLQGRNLTLEQFNSLEEDKKLQLGKEILKEMGWGEELNNDDEIALSWETMQAEVWLKTILGEHYHDLNGNHDLDPGGTKYQPGDFEQTPPRIYQWSIFHNFIKEKFGGGMDILYSQYLSQKPVFVVTPQTVYVHSGLIGDGKMEFNFDKLNNIMLTDTTSDSEGRITLKDESLLKKILWGRSSDFTRDSSGNILPQIIENANKNIQNLLSAFGLSQGKIIAGHVPKEQIVRGRPAAGHITGRLITNQPSGLFQEPEIRNFYRVHANRGDLCLYVEVLDPKKRKISDKIGFKTLEELGCQAPENYTDQVYFLPPIKGNKI